MRSRQRICWRDNRGEIVNAAMPPKPTFEEFYESQGSRYLQMEGDALKAHGEDQKKLLYEAFGSVKTLVQTIGVVAGFGFTALGHVKSVPLFVAGESFLLVSILVGLWWNHYAYTSNLDSTTEAKAEIKKMFATRFAVFKSIYDRALDQIRGGSEFIDISDGDIANLEDANNTLLQQFMSQKSDGKRWDPYLLLMIAFGVGAISLLASFTNHGAAVTTIHQWFSSSAVGVPNTGATTGDLASLWRAFSVFRPHFHVAARLNEVTEKLVDGSKCVPTRAAV